MYKCLTCKKEFTQPKQQDDVVNDEQYLYCPYCGSEDYFQKPDGIVVALMVTGKSFLVSVAHQGKLKRVYATIDPIKAYNKMREWQWKFIYSPLN